MSQKAKPFKVIIAGGRYFSDYDLLKSKLDIILKNKPNVTIVSGGANGADALGEKYANEKGFQIDKYPANWIKNGRAAGPIRNSLMADNANALVAFWDGVSRGTRNMIQTAREKSLEVRVVYY